MRLVFVEDGIDDDSEDSKLKKWILEGSKIQDASKV